MNSLSPAHARYISRTPATLRPKTLLLFQTRLVSSAEPAPHARHPASPVVAPNPIRIRKTLLPPTLGSAREVKEIHA